MAKSFVISKWQVFEAYKTVKANGGAAGVDGQSLEEFDRQLRKNLYRIWNRLSSGSYFPPPVRAVPIPKKSGGVRVLGVPTVSDRIAQTVVKMSLEPLVEPHFHEDSYGYRPHKSAHQALAVTRQRCWWYDWVLEFDIRGFFDAIGHDLLMKALRRHTTNKWVLLYVERWLKAPLQEADGRLIVREKGTPQGGVISPLLANLFLHYVFDAWMLKHFPKIPFCRYADDGLLHCRSRKQAEFLKSKIGERLRECGLEIHPDKTKIVYCKDINRTGEYPLIQFDFLGYTFRPRLSKDKYGRCFANFTPAVSGSALKAIRQEVRSWKINLKSEKSLKDLSHMFGPVIRGWLNYYARFHRSGMHSVGRQLNEALTRWAMRKHKGFGVHKTKAGKWLARIAKSEPNLFPHWQFGFRP